MILGFIAPLYQFTIGDTFEKISEYIPTSTKQIITINNNSEHLSSQRYSKNVHEVKRMSVEKKDHIATWIQIHRAHACALQTIAACCMHSACRI